MIVGWIVVFCIIELYGVSIAVFAKRRGEKGWAYNLIPFVASTYVNRNTRGFKILSIPRQKFPRGSDLHSRGARFLHGVAVVGGI